MFLPPFCASVRDRRKLAVVMYYNTSTLRQVKNAYPQILMINRDIAQNPTMSVTACLCQL